MKEQDKQHHTFDADSRWEIIRGRLPLMISLDPAEVAASQQPGPFFILYPRVGSFSQLIFDIFNYFQTYLVPSYGRPLEPWFDYKGKLLQWWFPLGVIFDVYGQNILPWRLTVHFMIPPVSSSSKLCSIESVILPDWKQFLTYHCHVVKQALYIFHGNSKAFGSLHHEIQTRMAESIRQLDLRRFDTIWFRSLLKGHFVSFRKTPLRIHLEGRHVSRLCCIPAGIQRHSNQLTGPLITLKDCLIHMILPKDVPFESIEIIIHGVTIVDPDIPLIWLSLVAGYLDGFLHITLRSVQEQLQRKEQLVQIIQDDLNTSIIPKEDPLDLCNTSFKHCQETPASTIVVNEDSKYFSTFINSYPIIPIESHRSHYPTSCHLERLNHRPRMTDPNIMILSLKQLKKHYLQNKYQPLIKQKKNSNQHSHYYPLACSIRARRLLRQDSLSRNRQLSCHFFTSHIDDQVQWNLYRLRLRYC